MFISSFNSGVVRGPFLPVEEAATIVIDASICNNYAVTLSASRILGAPINPQGDGQPLILAVTQSGAGSFLLTLNAIFHFGATLTSFTLSTTTGLTDYIGMIYRQSRNQWDVVSFMAGF